MVLSECMRVVLLIMCLEMLSCPAFVCDPKGSDYIPNWIMYRNGIPFLEETMILFLCPSLVFHIPTSFYMTILILCLIYNIQAVYSDCITSFMQQKIYFWTLNLWDMLNIFKLGCSSSISKHACTYLAKLHINWDSYLWVLDWGMFLIDKCGSCLKNIHLGIVLDEGIKAVKAIPMGTELVFHWSICWWVLHRHIPGLLMASNWSAHQWSPPQRISWAAAGIPLQHHLMVLLYRKLTGLLLEPRHLCGLGFFIWPNSRAI